MNKKDPLDEIFVEKVSLKDLKEKDEEIEMLKEGISDEIDNLREDIKRLKERNGFLEEQDRDFQRVFNDDKKLFQQQSKEIKRLKENFKDLIKSWILSNWKKQSINKFFSDFEKKFRADLQSVNYNLDAQDKEVAKK